MKIEDIKVGEKYLLKVGTELSEYPNYLSSIKYLNNKLVTIKNIKGGIEWTSSSKMKGAVEIVEEIDNPYCRKLPTDWLYIVDNKKESKIVLDDLLFKTDLNIVLKTN